jgi:hypothetical protein
MRACRLGEIYQSVTGKCISCAAGTYSLHLNSTLCINCPDVGVASCPGGNQLMLKYGYWRDSIFTDNIAYCKNL